ncbi:15958_t:CDS:2, partial [Acaulospora morrowiae]
DPSTNEYCLVMDYAKNQDLRTYLNNNYKNMNWISNKLQILGSLVRGLKLIHDEGFTHGDLHSGNVLIGDDEMAIITDLVLSPNYVGEGGLTKDEPKGMYGVLSFVAPEVLQCKPYTTLSDVYSFGILMWTLTSGTSPLSNFDFTTALAWYFMEKDHEQFKNSDDDNGKGLTKPEKTKKVIADEKFYSQFIDLEAISKIERFEELD